MANTNIGILTPNGINSSKMRKPHKTATADAVIPSSVIRRQTPTAITGSRKSANAARVVKRAQEAGVVAKTINV